jgi:hypothetical protein
MNDCQQLSIVSRIVASGDVELARNIGDRVRPILKALLEYPSDAEVAGIGGDGEGLTWIW